MVSATEDPGLIIDFREMCSIYSVQHTVAFYSARCFFFPMKRQEARLKFSYWREKAIKFGNIYRFIENDRACAVCSPVRCLDLHWFLLCFPSLFTLYRTSYHLFCCFWSLPQISFSLFMLLDLCLYRVSIRIPFLCIIALFLLLFFCFGYGFNSLC